jgi:hypothetical protein
MTLEQIIDKVYVRGEYIHKLPPESVPDAETFFYNLKKQCPDYLGIADGEHEYHEQKVYWFYLTPGYMYAIIPDYDKMERFDGEWASPESAIEMAQESQHESWELDKERKQFIKDIQHYISQL